AKKPCRLVVYGPCGENIQPTCKWQRFSELWRLQTGSQPRQLGHVGPKGGAENSTNRLTSPLRQAIVAAFVPEAPSTMNFGLQPWQLLVAVLAGWVNHEQQAAIEFLRTEVEVLTENLGKKRILLTDDQRRRLAVKGKVLGRKALEAIATIVTPDTILRWHRQLIAEKWDYAARRSQKPGRPPTPPEVVELVVRLARENPGWGYNPIQGALANLGHDVSDTTVGTILKAHGIEPAPKRCRQTSWRTFLKAHWNVLASIDFTTIEVWTSARPVTYYLLFELQAAIRRVCFACCTVHPDAALLAQASRNLSDGLDGFLRGTRYLLLDRDSKYSAAFLRILNEAGVHCVRLPPRS